VAASMSGEARTPEHKSAAFRFTCKRGVRLDSVEETVMSGGKHER
jgi:hypothetical protein